MLTVMDDLPLPSQTEQNKQMNMLKPKQCPNCAETNTPESKFCVKCKFVLSFDLYYETINEAEQTKKELAELKAKQQEAIEKEEKRLYNMEDMQKELKAVKEQLTSLPEMFLSRISTYEPEFAQFYKNKRDKKENISLKEEVPQPKTWQGEAVLSYYGLENEELIIERDWLKYRPEKVLEIYNKVRQEQEKKKKEDNENEKS
jgi:hypothetical protein